MQKLMLLLALLCACTPGAPVHAAAPPPSFTLSDASCVEGVACVFKITKSAKAISYSKVTFQTHSGSALPVKDYSYTAVTIIFGNNDLVKTVAVPTIGNIAADGSRAFKVQITALRYAAISRGMAVGTITDDDVAPPAPPAPPCNRAANGDCETPPPPPVVTPPPVVVPPPPPATDTCPDGTIVPQGAACPPPPVVTPPPPVVTPPPPPPAVTIEGVAPIASNFDTAPLFGTAGIDPKTGTTIPQSAAPDVVGAFRFICGPGQLLPDDPILYPGQPGASHLHQFYGNDGANAASTYASLRQSGGSTCGGKPGFALNRSAYWMAAMLDGKGNVVRPDYVAIYYKRRPITDPKCSSLGKFVGGTVFGGIGKCIPIPNGLKFIFGFDPTGVNSAPTGKAYFNCQGPTAISGHYNSLDEVVAANACPAGKGNQLGWIIQAPECVNGKDVDQIDHRSHVAYMKVDAGASGQVSCPATHPYVIPGFLLGAWFTVPAGSDLSKWDFSCASMAPGKPRGYCGHADYFEAWDPPTKAEWTANCIDKMLNCSAGNLGSGRRIIGAEVRKDPNPKVVPLSSLAAAMP